MKPVVVSDVLAVGEFPQVEQFAILAKAGFRSVINNQPDGEIARFASAEAAAVAAEAAGLEYRYLPLPTRTPNVEQIAAFEGLLRELPSPIYAFCYSGSRSAAACALAMAKSAEPDAIIEAFAKAGFDISGLRPWLEEARARPSHQAGSSNGSAPPVRPAETAPPAPQLPRSSSSAGFAM